MMSINSDDAGEMVVEKKASAVALLSGGLDSTIAARILLDQGIELHALNFHSPFCTCTSKNAGSCNAVVFAKKLGIPLKMMVKGDDYLAVVKNPKFGYGRNMNPCIDCRIFILKKAKEYAKEIGASFIVTGEVLDQRPKSQHVAAMNIIDREAGLEGLVLRPLSARLLPPTAPELAGLVDRERLLEIRGRSRSIQLRMGRDFHLVDQYCANGGCRLTDKEYAAKVRDYLEHIEDPRMADMKWMTIGRHYRFDGVKIIAGRNEPENHQIRAWKSEGDAIVELDGNVGPTAIVFSPYSSSAIQFAVRVLLEHSKARDKQDVRAILESGGNLDVITPEIDDILDIDSYRVCWQNYSIAWHQSGRQDILQDKIE
jgi:hypothetical protein